VERPWAVVVANPTKIPDIDGEIDWLEERSVELGWARPVWLETTPEDPGVGQTRVALRAGAHAVLAYGGDGTVRHVASALTGSGVPLGLLPAGTGNLLARNMGVDITDPISAAYDVLNGTERMVDVARTTFDGSDDENVFLVMAGVGYDAAIMADTVDALKDRMGWLAYVEAGIRKLPGKPVRATVRVEGRHPVKRRIRSVMAGNCGRIMGGIEIFPEAKIDDGVLDLLVLAPKGRFGWLGVAAGIFGRRKNQKESAEYFQGKKVEVTLEQAEEFQLDGDHVGTVKHLTIWVDPGALKVRM
jgi:diacylglycerol kinase family enzyme